jgi:hypothetical protein
VICLSREELTELSGYRQRAAVTRWLRENTIPFYIGGDGWPRVLHSVLGVSKPKTLIRSQPNVAALKEWESAKTQKVQTRSA